MSTPATTGSDAAPTVKEPKPNLSNLDLVKKTDNFPYEAEDPKRWHSYMKVWYSLYVNEHPSPVGLIKPDFVKRSFQNVPNWKVDDTARTITLIADKNTHESRTAAVRAQAIKMRDSDGYECISLGKDGKGKKWRNEEYTIFGKNGEKLFDMERSATPLFGVVTYGVHMTAFLRKKPTTSKTDKDSKAKPPSKAGPPEKIWVARRAKEKSTYPSMLDNTAAGGLAAGEKPFDAMVREAGEEAGLEKELVEEGLHAAGSVVYSHLRDKSAGGETDVLQGEVQYVYDLEVHEGVEFKPADGEAEGFECLTVDQVQKALREGEFKPNCALVLIDFLIRHGFITPDNEPGFNEIMARLHRKLDFPLGNFC